MKIVSFIDEPQLIRRILEHLDLWCGRVPKGLPPPSEQEEKFAEPIVSEGFDDGWGHHIGTGGGIS